MDVARAEDGLAVARLRPGSPPNPSPGEAWFFLACLSLIFVLAIADRLALALMVEPIKAELGLSDVQFGLLVGTAFGAIFAFASLPLSWLADWWNRRLLLLLAVLFWSGMTLSSAFVHSFGLLVVGRVGLAVGEAALMPVAISLIASLFPADRRALPTAIFMASAMVGTAMAYVIAGLITTLAGAGAFAGLPLLSGLSGWRATLAVLGLVGIVLALTTFALTREPPRQRRAGPAFRTGDPIDPEIGGAFGSMRRGVPFFALFFFGCSATAMLSYGIPAWYPTHLIRFFGHDASAAGRYAGFVFLVGGIGGSLLVPATVQWLMRRGRRHVLVTIAILLALVGSAASYLAGAVTDVAGSIAAAIAAIFCVNGIGTLPHLLAVVAAPALFRGRVSATALFLANLIGFGCGPVLVAWFAEHIFAGPHAIGRALGMLAMFVAPTALFLMGAARIAYRRADFSRIYATN